MVSNLLLKLVLPKHYINNKCITSIQRNKHNKMLSSRLKNVQVIMNIYSLKGEPAAKYCLLSLSISLSLSLSSILLRSTCRTRGLAAVPVRTYLGNRKNF